MTSAPRISVVVPGRDVSAYVADALQSLTRQVAEPHDLEVVVVDDGSTDDTAGVVSHFRDRLPRLELLRNEEPVGIAGARNQGVAATSGRLLAFLDADDWLAPGHLAHVADSMDALRVPFVRTDHTTVRGRHRHLVRAPQSVRGVALVARDSILPVDDRTMVDYPYSWAGMFDRALLADDLLSFRADLRTAEDRPWIWRLFLEAGRYAVVDAPGICYRRGLPSSLSQTYDARQLDVVPALHATFDVLERSPDTDRYLPKLARTAVGLLTHHLRRSPQMPPGARSVLRDGASELLARIPADLLAIETARMHPGRAYMLQGLLPDFDVTLRHRPAPALVSPPPTRDAPAAPWRPVVLALALTREDAELAAAADVRPPQGRREHVLVTPGGRDTVPDIVRSAFDRCVDLDDILPADGEPAWPVAPDSEPMFERLLRARWRVEDAQVELVLPSLSGLAGRLAELFHDASITVASGRPDVYGPELGAPLAVSQRVRQVCHLDLLDGFVPLLATQHGVPAVPIDVARSRLALPTEALASDGPLPRRDVRRMIGRAVVEQPVESAAGLLATIVHTHDPDHTPWLRRPAERYLATTDLDVTDWIDADRITELGLPGGRRPTWRMRRRTLLYAAVRHPVAAWAAGVADRLGVRSIAARLLGRHL